MSSWKKMQSENSAIIYVSLVGLVVLIILILLFVKSSNYANDQKEVVESPEKSSANAKESATEPGGKKGESKELAKPKRDIDSDAKSQEEAKPHPKPSAKQSPGAKEPSPTFSKKKTDLLKDLNNAKIIHDVTSDETNFWQIAVRAVRRMVKKRDKCSFQKPGTQGAVVEKLSKGYVVTGYFIAPDMDNVMRKSYFKCWIGKDDRGRRLIFPPKISSTPF